MTTSSLFQALVAATVLIASPIHGAETIVIKGSDTLGAKLVPQLAESFRARCAEQGLEVAFEIAAEGSSTGVAAVIDGTAEIGMSSRDPKDTEISRARTSGVDMRTITIAKDGIAIIVNESNPMDSITLEEVEFIFSGDILDWSGITTQTGEISVYTRNTSSGTYAVFQKMAMNSRDYSSGSQKMAGNEQIAAEVASNPNGIGYVGLAYIDTPGTKVLVVEGKHPEDKGYPLARPLYLLINNAKPLKPITNDFIGYSMSPAGQRVVNRVHFLSVY